MGYYTRNGKRYITVTTVIDKMYPFNRESFNNWCKKNGFDPDTVKVISSSMGSKVSDWIDNKRRGLEFLNPPAIGKPEQGLYDATQNFTKEVELLSTEEEVYCDEYMYAGTYDGIIKKGDKKYLVEWKTYGAWREDYKRDPLKIKKVSIQLDMYRYALGEDLPLALIVFKTDGTYEVEEIKGNDSWKEWLKTHPQTLI